jgi:hypothetical protein
MRVGGGGGNWGLETEGQNLHLALPGQTFASSSKLAQDERNMKSSMRLFGQCMIWRR